MKKKLILITIMLIGIIAMYSSVYAADLVIKTAAELTTFSSDVKSGNTYEGKTIELGANIALSGTFTPIGTQSYPFAGTFNGKGYKITGLSTNENTNSGLFGRTAATAIIKNVKVSGTVTGTYNVGGIVGYNLGTIQGCTNNCSVGPSSTTAYYVGGIAGYSSGTITNVTNTGTINGYRYVGGIVGHKVGTAAVTKATNKASATITSNHSVYQSTSEDNFSCVGGIIGGAPDGGAITDCYNYAEIKSTASTGGLNIGVCGMGGILGHGCGTITNCHNSGNIVGNAYTGGIVGIMTGSNSAYYITKCSNTGNITGDGGYTGGIAGTGGAEINTSYNTGTITGETLIGGITGRIDGNITNVYNVGNVTGKTTSNGYAPGGIVGSMYNGGSVKYSYNTGTVSNTSNSDYVGGAVGYQEGATFTNVYYLSSSCSRPTSDSTSVTGITSRSSSNMKTTSMVSLLNASQSPTVWTIVAGTNNGYPILIDVTEIETIPNYSVGGVYYETLADAYGAISGTSGTIEVLETNVTDSSTFTVASDKTITLNIPSGKTITKTGSTITNAGTFIITGSGTITTSGAFSLITNNGTLKINGTGTLSQTNTGSYYVIDNTGTVNVTNGKIIANTVGIANTSGTVTIGTNDETINTTSPIIIGGTNGYYTSTANSTLEFYDGVFQSGTAAISADDAVTVKPIIPTGYDVVYNDETIDGTPYKTAKLKKLPTLSVSDITLTAGETKTINYTYSGDGEISTVVGSDVIMIVEEIDQENKTMKIKGLSAGSTVVTVTSSETSEYASNTDTFIVTVTQKDVNGDQNITAEIEYTEVLYDGTARTPKVTIKDNGVELIENTHYTLSYENNTNAGTAKAIVTFKGNYSGRIELKFEIVKAILEVSAINTVATFDGNSYKISLEGDDLIGAEIVYSTTIGVYNTTENPSFIDAGTHTVYFKVSKTNYFDYMGTGTVTIKPRPINVDWTNTTLIYNGSTQTPTAGNNNVIDGINDEKINITVTGGQKNVGTYTGDKAAKATIASVTNGQANVANYTLTNATVDFEIKPNEDSILSVTMTQNSFTYTGTEIKPAITVRDGALVLYVNTDYTVEYLNNINAESAQSKPTIKITGKGNYENVNTEVYFTITKRNVIINPDQAQSKVYGDENPKLTYTYQGNVYTENPAFSGDLSRIEGEDVGEYEITKGSLTLENNGTFLTSNYNLVLSDTKVNFEIVKRDISTVTASLTETTFEYDNLPKQPKATVMLNLETLKEGTDYEITYKNNVNVGEATAIINGIGNYRGTLKLTFQITDTTGPEAPIVVAKLNNYLGNEYVSGTSTNQNIYIELSSSDLGKVSLYEWSTEKNNGFDSEGIFVREGVGIINFQTEINEIIYFRAKDESGNYSETTSLRIIIDKTAPTGGVNITPMYENAGFKYTNIKNVSISINVSDDLTSSSLIQIALINESDLNANSTIEWTNYEASKSWNLSDNDGLKTIYILVRDEAGNQSAYIL